MTWHPAGHRPTGSGGGGGGEGRAGGGGDSGVMSTHCAGQVPVGAANRP